jgi:nucleoside-diphosphate-sugar epimerase
MHKGVNFIMGYEPIDKSKTYLITGAAGFIGYYLSKRLLDQGCEVIGIDNINDYYDVNLKHTRLDQLSPYEKFTFIKDDISDKAVIDNLFNKYKPNIVVNWTLGSDPRRFKALKSYTYRKALCEYGHLNVPGEGSGGSDLGVRPPPL